jgi:hypothetical protein
MYPSEMPLHVWNGQEDDPEWLDSWLQEIDHDVDTWRTVALGLFMLALIIAAFILHS